MPLTTMNLMLPCVRVTQPLDYFAVPELVAWKVRVGAREAGRVSKEAIKIGTRVDELIKTGSNPIKKDKAEVIQAHLAYVKWVQVYKPKDFEVGSRLEKDTEFCRVSGENDIITLGKVTDIKVASEIRLSYWVQVMVYNWLRNLTTDVAVLRLDKTTGQYEYVVKPFDLSLVVAWLGLARLYLYYKGECNDSDNESGFPEVGSKQEVA